LKFLGLTLFVQKQQEAINVNTRSRRVAHSPQLSVQIDPNLLPQIQEFGRKTILQVLNDVLS